MFFDLNVPVPSAGKSAPQPQSKKAKGKEPQRSNMTNIYTPAQISAIEARIDLLVHLGYAAIAFNHTVRKKVDSKTHANVLDGLVSSLKKRPGVVFLKRLTIVLDEDSEKGFGLTNANASLFAPYDLIALTPTTATSFSLACLSHTTPSPLTAHIISLPLTFPRLPFYLKHTLVRTALKNGAVFEINYSGALGGEIDPAIVNAGSTEGPDAKRNWWASAREVVRVTKGKGVIISGGIVSNSDLRAPRDICNLITLLGLAQDAAHHASTKEPKSLVLRAQTRKTFRAILSEPRIAVPKAPFPPSDVAVSELMDQQTNELITPQAIDTSTEKADSPVISQAQDGRKRTREDSIHQIEHASTATGSLAATSSGPSGQAPKKRKKGSKGREKLTT